MINILKRTIGSLMISNGIAMLRGLPKFETIIASSDKFKNALNKVGVKLNYTELDVNYAFTSYDNWQEIIRCLYDNIVKFFKWEAETFDCDNRAELMSALCSAIFGVALGRVYCEIYDLNGELKYLHWANLIVDRDNNAYLLDVDNGGLCQKITSNNVVMGIVRYKLITLRIG